MTQKKWQHKFNIYQLILLEWFMTNDRKGQTRNTQLYAEVVFAKKDDTLIPEILW